MQICANPCGNPCELVQTRVHGFPWVLCLTSSHLKDSSETLEKVLRSRCRGGDGGDWGLVVRVGVHPCSECLFSPDTQWTDIDQKGIIWVKPGLHTGTRSFFSCENGEVLMFCSISLGIGLLSVGGRSQSRSSVGNTGINPAPILVS